MRIPLFVPGFFFIACNLVLVAQSPIPKYEVKRASSPIVIDGRLDEKTWSAATAVEFIYPWPSQKGTKERTTARLLWDDEYIYVGYNCEDSDIVALHMDRDDPTYRDDAVEIFINAKPSQLISYFGLEMNARGVLYDYVSSDGRYFFKRFNMSGVKLASDIRGTLNMRGDKDEGWSLEVAIPWSNFEDIAPKPVVGTVWTANLNRWNGVEPDRVLSMWSDPQFPTPHPHVPARFGQLVFQSGR